jgi:hypothetical protein
LRDFSFNVQNAKLSPSPSVLEGIVTLILQLQYPCCYLAYRLEYQKNKVM